MKALLNNVLSTPEKPVFGALRIDPKTDTWIIAPHDGKHHIIVPPRMNSIADIEDALNVKIPPEYKIVDVTILDSESYLALHSKKDAKIALLTRHLINLSKWSDEMCIWPDAGMRARDDAKQIMEELSKL